MSSLTVFNFNNQEVRFVGNANDPWWVAADVCAVLEIANVSDAVGRLDDDEKLISSLPISGQTRDVLCINESGLYSLVLTSRKPQAKAFKKWLTADVIPSIRKTGKYESPSVATVEQKQTALIGVADAMLRLHDSTLPAAIKQIMLDSFADTLMTNNQKAITPNQERHLGAAQKAEELGFKLNSSSRTRLGKFVKSQGLTAVKEERLCNGQMRQINVYADTPELTQTIKTFFNS